MRNIHRSGVSMQRFSSSFLVFFLAFGLVLSGCASRGGKTYNDGEVRTVQNVQYGTVVDVSEVMIAEDPSLVGPIIVGVAGGVIGSLFGSGAGKTLATLGGATLGAILGGAGEASLRKYKASEITVELESGQTVMIVQGDDEFFVKGDRVRVVSTGEGRARVQQI